MRYVSTRGTAATASFSEILLEDMPVYKQQRVERLVLRRGRYLAVHRQIGERLVLVELLDELLLDQVRLLEYSLVILNNVPANDVRDEEKKGKDERGGMSRISRAPAFLRHSKMLEIPIGSSASADRLIQTPRAA